MLLTRATNPIKTIIKSVVRHVRTRGTKVHRACIPQEAHERCRPGLNRRCRHPTACRKAAGHFNVLG